MDGLTDGWKIGRLYHTLLKQGDKNENGRDASLESILSRVRPLTLLHSKRPNLYTILAFLSAMGVYIS